MTTLTTTTKHFLRKLTTANNRAFASKVLTRSLASLSVNPKPTTTTSTHITNDEITSFNMEYISAPYTALGVIHVNELLGNGRRSSSANDDILWSNSLSFAAPESDFVSSAQTAIGVVHKSEFLNKGKEEKQQLEQSDDKINTDYLTQNIDGMMMSAPETAFGAFHAGELQPRNDDSDTIVTYSSVESTIYSPLTATGTIPVTEMLDDTMKAALMEHQAARDALPKTVADALKDERPIVVTTAKAPFQVYDVNKAWEGLCGYSRDEAINKNVGELLQGPQTDADVATGMVQYLKTVGFSEATLTNYTKDGKSFENHVQVGVIHENNEEYFVGVLQDTGKKVSAM